MYKSLIIPSAKRDILDAAKWYNKQQKGLGKRFTTEVRQHVLFIRNNPLASNIRYKNIRTTVLKQFPFMIHYTIDESNKTIIITAILHTSRNPKVW